MRSRARAKAFKAGFVGRVGHHGDRFAARALNLGDHSIQIALRARSHNHSRARLRQPHRDAAPNALSAAGYNRNFAIKPECVENAHACSMRLVSEACARQK